MNLMGLYISLVFFLFAVLARLQHGSWFAPGAFIAVYWAFLVFVPLTFAPDFIFSPLAIFVLLVCVGSVTLGSLIGIACGRYLLPRPAVHLELNNIPIPWLRILIVSGFLSGAVAVAVLLASSGRSIATLFSITELARAGREFSVARYQAGYIPPVLCRLLLTGTYFSALLGGVLLATQPKSFIERFLSVLPLIPIIVYATLLTTRATILSFLILWLSGYISMRVYLTHGKVQIFKFAILFRIFIVAISFFIIFIALQMSRYGWSSSDQLFAVLSRARIWFYGYLSGFSVWFDQWNMQTWNPSFGTHTFGGVFDFLGFVSRSQGIYQDYAVIGNETTTNIYTLFRGLFLDYGIFGSLVIFFTSGLISGFSYYRVKCGFIQYLPVLCLFYFVILWSHIVCPLNYNTLILAWVLFYGYFIFVSCQRHFENYKNFLSSACKGLNNNVRRRE